MLAAALAPLLIAEDFVEGTHLGEVHVTRRPPRRALGANVLRPEVVGEQLIGLGVHVLQCQQVAQRLLLPEVARRGAQREGLA